jgi:hypothetical protein
MTKAMSERGRAKDRRHVVIPGYALKSKLRSEIETAPLSPRMKAAAAMALLSEGQGAQGIEQRLAAIETLRKLLI